MCGIFGALGTLSPDAIDGVSAAMAHRGPDAEGRLVGPEITLVHRRLKIIDLSAAGNQPMPNEDGSIQVVFNGEIYNHHELRRQLERAGHKFRSRCDTEAIAHGYEQWGDAVVEKLDGMFAFGLWDSKRKRLLLARDRVGKKPLYFARTPSFRFASTIGALHASGIEREVAVDSLPYYLAYGFVPPPATHYRGIEQLEPATLLTVEDGRIETRRYWEPRFGEFPPTDARAAGVYGFDEAAQRVRKLVTRAVACRLESDVPLGAFLSGGIDSTIVVGVMSSLMKRRVKTFSIGFAGDARYDETRYARIASRAFDTDHVEFRLQPSSIHLLDKLVRFHDGPFGDSSAIPTYIVAQLTREHVTVALTGDGGDELFCGYSRFLAAEFAEHIPGVLRGPLAHLSSAMPGIAHDRSALGRAWRFLSATDLSLADRMARWNSFFHRPADVLRDDVSATLAHKMDAPADWQREVFALSHGNTVLSRVLEHNFRTYLPYDLLVKADRTSMAHGLELRSPFLDTVLVQYASSLPIDFLRRGFATKRILRHAFRDLLPGPIQRRGKMGFGVPLATWFRTNLREYLRDHFGGQARMFDFVDRAKVLRLVDEHGRGVADHSQRLWLLLTLEVWLQGLRDSAVACAA
jgi:asparagine synthase (glutamine-hydrolysing)